MQSKNPTSWRERPIRRSALRNHILISISAKSGETGVQRRSLQPAGRLSVVARLKPASSVNSCRVSGAASVGRTSMMSE